MMDQTDWTYILAVVVLVLVSILAFFDKITAEDVMKVFLLVIGAFLGVSIGYAVGYSVGYKKGAGVSG